jgi:hypothetical protein
MHPPYSTLTPIHIYNYAATLLEPYLQWHDYGPKCTVKVLLQVLFYAAGHLCSVFAACSQLRTAGMGAKPWSMPVRGLVPPAPLGFIKPTVGALELRPATANLMRPGSKPPLVTQPYDSCSSPSP